MDNLEYWNKLKQPPATALKTIGAGRLKGMSDISPQWRYQVMTEVFGPCGKGWRYTINELWTVPGTGGEVFAFARVAMQYIIDVEKETWSDLIPGVGGSMLITNEARGLHDSDEAFKMAVTDALGTAMKMIGVAADIYLGRWDGSKYQEEKQTGGQGQPPKQTGTPSGAPETVNFIPSACNKKAGVKKDGKPYTKFVIKGPAGEYQTFSETFAQFCKASMDEGMLIGVTYTTNQYGNTITSVGPAKYDKLDDDFIDDIGAPMVLGEEE